MLRRPPDQIRHRLLAGSEETGLRAIEVDTLAADPPPANRRGRCVIVKAFKWRKHKTYSFGEVMRQVFFGPWYVQS